MAKYLEKYLAKLFLPLSQFIYTITSTKHFIEQIKNLEIPSSYGMVSFDVESLHTSIPLEKTIKITLQKIYDQREIKTQIPEKLLKELILSCTNV